MKTEILVAEQKRTEQALRESEQRYKRLLAATTDYIYSVDLGNGHAGVTSHGPGCESVTGYTQHEFTEDQHLWYRVIHEADRKAVMAQIDRILHDEPVLPLEHRIIRKDGQVRWVLNTTIAHRNQDGRLIGYDGLISDVTQRKLAEVALQESQSRLELMIQGSNDGVWDWNLVTGEVYFSPRWKSMLGYEDQELKNERSTWEDLLHPADREKALAEVKACLSGLANTFELEQRLRHKDGTYRWILSRAVVLRDPQGRPVRMAGSHVDLTEHKYATEQVQQANTKLERKSDALRKAVRRLIVSQRELRKTQEHLVQTAKLELAGTLAAGVAHEVKNPLQTILMGVHLLSEKLSEPQRTPEIALALQEMSSAVSRAKAIIGDLMALTHPMQFQRQWQDLHPVIDSSLRLLRNEMMKARIKVECQFDAALPPALLDPQRLEQVFLNLLINAIQAMPNGGLINIRTSAKYIGAWESSQRPLFRNFNSGDQVVLVTIQDRGTGIPEELLPRVFDPFFTTKPPGLGTGLGLSMAKKIVELHDGAIELKNAATGGVVAAVAIRLNGGQNNERNEKAHFGGGR